MKNFIKYALCCIFAALGVVACETTIEDNAPGIDLTAVETTETSISFVINTKSKTCAYMLYDGNSIDAKTVLSQGIKTDGGLITINNLEADTEYHIVAVATNGKDNVMQTLTMKTLKAENGGNGDNGDNDDPNNGSELPNIDGVENVTIVSTSNGYWYQYYNYYVTLIADNGDSYILDFYTIDETMSLYLPYGQYFVGNSIDPYTINSEYSGYVPAGKDADSEGYNFTDGYVTVDVENGNFAIYFYLSYVANGVTHTKQGYYNGPLSGASLPNEDSLENELIEVVDVKSSSFTLKGNAPEGAFWLCSIAEKSIYNMQQLSPSAWVLNYGFLLQGPQTITWKNGEEFIAGYTMNVAPNTDYIIFAALVDETGANLISGISVIELRTEPMQAGNGVVEVTIKEVGVYDVTFDCTMGAGVAKYMVTVYRSEQVEDARKNWSQYTSYGINSFEDMMFTLISTGSSPRARTFYESAEIKWEELWAHHEHQVCIMVEDANGGASLVLSEPFTTL